MSRREATPEPPDAAAAGSTRTRILDVAEQLFATRGFDGTSLRAVTRSAGVNLAAVNYHFGSKAGLLQEVLGRHITPINSERLAQLDTLEGAGTPGVRELVRAFVEAPLRHFVAMGERGQAVMRVLGRSHSAPQDITQEIVREHFGEVAGRFHAAFARALPHLPPEEISWRLMALVGVFTFFLSSSKICKVNFPMPDEGDMEALVERIVAFAAPGFEAPVQG